MWKSFHHPDISLPVVRRRVGLELLEILDLFGDVGARGAWAFLHNRTGSSKQAYNQAVYRLSKQGLIVKGQGLDTPLLKLSTDAKGLLDPYLKPEHWWRRKWNGIWYVLVYDVPEADRPYRNTLRTFLKKQRVGCFQKSVWITPHDIRPQYSDLKKAAAVDVFACLFEARTVLGMSAETIVREAWDFERLYEVQKRFCDIYAENLEILQEVATVDFDGLVRLATEEMDAFRSAFLLDPLLPNKLLPYFYLGKEVYAIHLRVVDELRKKFSR